MNVIDVAQKLAGASGSEPIQTVASFNDHQVRVVDIKGEGEWHKHDDTDELVYLVSGDLTIRFRDGAVALRPGQLYVVPRGREHSTLAAEETQAMII